MAHDKDNMNEGLKRSTKKIAGMPDNSFIASNKDIETAKEEMMDELEAISKLEYPEFSSMESKLAAIFEDARKWKEDETDVQQIIIDNLNRRNGKYGTDKLEKIKQAGSSDVFIGLTGVKCRSFESFIHDIYTANKKRTWTLKATPIPELTEEDKQKIVQQALQEFMQKANNDPNIQEQEAYTIASTLRQTLVEENYKTANKKAEEMSRLIDDQMIEGDFEKAFDEAIMDLSCSKAAIIKGPLIRKRPKRNGWKTKGKKTVPVIEEELVVTFERVSPLDFYPGRSNRSVDDGPIVEKTFLSKDSLLANRSESGYLSDNIEYILKENDKPAYNELNYSDDKEELERREHDDSLYANEFSPNVEAFEYWVHCKGSMLPDYGITKDIHGKKLDPLKDYDVNAITVDGLLVYVHLNQDILGRRPYSVYGFAKEIGGFWYQGIPEIIKNEQDIANAAARSMVNNLGIASGPQVVIPDINRIPEGEDITSMYPWKIWQGSSMGGNQGPLIDFYQPESRSREMLDILNRSLNIADSTLEMPQFNSGPEKVGTAGRTSSGLSMIISNSNRGLKRVLLGIDKLLIKPLIDRLYDYNMMTSDDDAIKGDMNFVSDGIVALLMKEQISEKRLSLLNITNNEFDQKILGLDGRAKILADAMETLETDYDDIKPSEEKIKTLIDREETMQKQAIEQNRVRIEREAALIEREAQVAQAEIQLEQQKLQLKAQELQVDDRNTNKELDIRASKQSQSMFETMIKTNAKSEQADTLSELSKLQQGVMNESAETQPAGDAGVETNVNEPTVEDNNQIPGEGTGGDTQS